MRTFVLLVFLTIIMVGTTWLIVQEALWLFAPGLVRDLVLIVGIPAALLTEAYVLPRVMNGLSHDSDR